MFWSSTVCIFISLCGKEEAYIQHFCTPKNDDCLGVGVGRLWPWATSGLTLCGPSSLKHLLTGPYQTKTCQQEQRNCVIAWIVSWTYCIFQDTLFFLERSRDRQTMVIQNWYLADIFSKMNEVSLQGKQLVLFIASDTIWAFMGKMRILENLNLSPWAWQLSNI